MSCEDNKYTNHISRGVNEINDKIFDFLKERITPPFLDVGTNIGVLLSEIEGGTGVDASLELVMRAKEQGLNVIHADAINLPFEDYTFQTVVLSCVLEQITMWQDAIEEAIRVCKMGGKVIGVNPIPESPIWGVLGGTEWVKTTIEPDVLIHEYKARITYPIKDKYYFEITKSVDTK